MVTNIATSFLENTDARGSELFLKLTTSSGIATFSYNDIRELASTYNGQFRTSRLPKGSVVAIVLTHGVELYGAFLGAVMAGLVPTIMPFPNPKQDHARYWRSHLELFKQTDIRAILTFEANVGSARTHLGETLDFLATPAHIGSSPPCREVADSNIALLQHSSGTTGLKKGVMLSHVAIQEQVHRYARALGIEPGHRIVSWLPLYHDMGLVACFLLPLILGCPISHLDPFAWSARPTTLLDEIVDFQGQWCWLPNFAFNHIINNVRHGRQWNLSTIRAFVNCSEPCKPSTFERFRSCAELTDLAPTALQVCYAMAENVFAVTQTDVRTSPRTLAVTARSLREGHRIEIASETHDVVRLLSCGRTISGVQANIVDNTGRILEERMIGEITISGASLYSGYYKRPELTAERLLDGWHHTGDIGFRYEGELYVIGRKDDLLIIRGKNVYAHEVEEVVNSLNICLPGRVVALGLPNERLGTLELGVVGECKEGVTEAEAWKEVRRAVEDQLGVDVRRFRLVPPGALVKTTSGKLSRRDNSGLLEG